MELAMEETIWTKTVVERVSEDQPIRHGICLALNELNERNMVRHHCLLQDYETFPLPTGRG
jgi:hypothetical protein